MSDDVCDDIHSLTGAYVLDALPEAERVAFEQHLSSCTTCSTEVAELRETTGRLSAAFGASPPPALKNSVMAAIGEIEQLPPVSDAGRAAGLADQTAPRRRSLLALAAAVVVVAGVGGVAVDQYRKNTAAQDETDRIAAVLAQPDARTVRGSLTGGGEVAMVASAKGDAAVVVLRDLPRLPAQKTYQLWLIDKAKAAHSAGLVAPDAANQTKILAGDVVGKVAFGVSIEPKGGSRQPTMQTATVLPLTA